MVNEKCCDVCDVVEECLPPLATRRNYRVADTNTQGHFSASCAKERIRISEMACNDTVFGSSGEDLVCFFFCFSRQYYDPI